MTTLRDALIAAVRAGNDTDTIAAIAGVVAGAGYGGSAVPFAWPRRLHGWPGPRARDLTQFAILSANGGRPSHDGWPNCERLASYAGASTVIVAHPDDPGVLLGAVGALQPGVADAVVSLCRLGSTQAPLEGVAPQDHLEVWLVDKDDANNDAALVLRDAADAVRALRDEGKTVLLRCVHADTAPRWSPLSTVLGCEARPWPRCSTGGWRSCPARSAAALCVTSPRASA